jgi:nicotinamide-nucleotide amidase
VEHVENKIHALLIKKQLTIACAESCTGGLLAHLLTEQAGSSRFFLLGIVAYSNRAKVRLLHVPASLIRHQGAVSYQVAIHMAQNVRRLADADIGIGVTGIAGPTGATPEKPVGTVFIAVADGRNTLCARIRFTGKRRQVRQGAALNALCLLSGLIR